MFYKTRFFSSLIKLTGSLVSLSLLLGMFVRPVFAQTISCTDFLCDPHNTFCGVLCQIVPKLPTYVIGGGVIAAIVFIVIYGISYILAADDAKKITNARMGLLYAVVGLAALIMAFAVFSMIALILGASPSEIFVIRNVGNCPCS